MYIQSIGTGSQPSLSHKESTLKAAAQEFEAAFLAEMLKSAGLGQQSSEFGGGAGEEQFASFLVQEHAKALVENGGVGLAEAIFESLKERANVNQSQ